MSESQRGLVVGFDLDMTLVDSADGIVECLTYVCALYGVTLDHAEAHQGVGWPLDTLFGRWVPDAPVDDMTAAYRARYLTHVVPNTQVMPGAHDALEAVRARGGRVLVVSAKRADHVQAVLDAGRLPADHVIGSRFAEAKGEALAAEGAWAYVGDHAGDMTAARHAGALGVGVPSGPATADELAAAGAHVVLPSIAAFPDWLESTLGR